MPLMLVVRSQDRPVVVIRSGGQQQQPTTPEVRKLQHSGFECLNTALRRVGEPNYPTLLNLTLEHILGPEDWREFDGALAELPDRLRYLEMAAQVLDLLDDVCPAVILATMNGIMAACRQIELRQRSS